MKILFVTHQESDFGGAYLYNGLCQELGPENVWDYPPKLSYHGQEHRYTLPDGSPGLTGPLPWMPGYAFPYPDELRNDPAALVAEVHRMLREGKFGLVFLESFRVNALETFYNLQQSVLAANVPVVAHDGEDYDTFHPETVRVRPAVVFKREMRKEEYSIWPTTIRPYGHEFTVFPFPFSFPGLVYGPLAPHPAPDGLVFMMGYTHKRREEVARALRADPAVCCQSYIALAPDYEQSLQQTLLPWGPYLERMYRAAIGVSVRGFGWDTCRYWEVPSQTVMLCDQTALHHPAPFAHDTTCLVYSNPEHCAALAKEYLKRPVDLARIRTAGMEHTRTHHTNQARARWALDRLRETGVLKGE